MSLNERMLVWNLEQDLVPCEHLSNTGIAYAVISVNPAGT